MACWDKDWLTIKLCHEWTSARDQSLFTFQWHKMMSNSGVVISVWPVGDAILYLGYIYGEGSKLGGWHIRSEGESGQNRNHYSKIFTHTLRGWTRKECVILTNKHNTSTLISEYLLLHSVKTLSWELKWTIPYLSKKLSYLSSTILPSITLLIPRYQGLMGIFNSHHLQ